MEVNHFVIVGVFIVFVILVSIQYTLNRMYVLLREILRVLEAIKYNS